MQLVHWRFGTALVLVVSSSLAQVQFAEGAKHHLPRDADLTYAILAVDVDADGDLDLVCANRGQNRLYSNDGSGRFTDVTATRMPVDDNDSFDVATGDVDGDGDLDLAFANSFSRTQQNRLYLNDGSGAFTDATATRMPIDDDSSQGVVMGDLDGDGDVDMVFGNAATLAWQNRLYLNDGSGTFTDVTTTQMPVDNDLTRAVALGDVDGDGDSDLVFGNTAQNRLYLNDGAGTFSDATAARLPVAASERTYAVALGDVDGDGNPDLVVGNQSQQSRLYLNDGSGSFSDVTATRMPVAADDTHCVTLGDVDGDGDQDLVLGNGAFADQQNRLYLNDGSGVFTDGTEMRLPIGADGTHVAISADVDGDGSPDVVYANEGQNRLALNDGTGRFAEGSVPRLPPDRDNTTDLTMGDVDGDGDLDLVVGNSGQNRLYLNDGGGDFVDATATRLPAFNDLTGAVELGDVDGDGDLDLLVGNLAQYYSPFSSRNRLYLNDGTGTFTDVTASRMPARGYDTRAMALADLDGDGDLDLVSGNFEVTIEAPVGAANRLYENDGSGTFSDVTAAQMPPNGGITSSVAVGDVDGDGDLDMVFGNEPFCFTYCTGGGQTTLYLNDGAGSFTGAPAGRIPADGSISTSDVAAADVDGDGDLDLVIGNLGQDRLYLNDGTGTFSDATAARMPVVAGATTGLAVGDVDSDGDPDLVLANVGPNRLYLNDGTGTFSDVSAARLPAVADTTRALALGDTDADGDPDVVAGNDDGFRGRQNRCYVNLVRQLEVPLLVRPGRPYRLDVYSRYDPLPGPSVALVMLSTAAARIPLPPYGTFGLAPAQLLIGPSFGIPRPNGVQTVSFPVPDDPSVVGLSLYAQAVLVRGSVQVRLTNWAGDEIVP